MIAQHVFQITASIILFIIALALPIIVKHWLKAKSSISFGVSGLLTIGLTFVAIYTQKALYFTGDGWHMISYYLFFGLGLILILAGFVFFVVNSVNKVRK